MRRPSIQIRPELYLLACICVLFVPLRLVIAWLLSVFIHEFFHYIAIHLCRCTVLGIEAGISGITMITGKMSPLQEIICAAAGPMSGLLLLLTAKWTPLLSVLGVIHSAYNLLPLYPLDGGRILNAFIDVLDYKYGIKILSALEHLFCFAIAIGTLYCSVILRLGALPILIGLILIFRHIKFTCKLRTD